MLKVGDLVTFNSAGMKYKTLGLVLDIETNSKYKRHNEILIMWGIVGDFMPRKSLTRGARVDRWHAKIRSGDIVWHELGRWFEKAD